MTESQRTRHHLMTLCHQDDCCPEIFYHENRSSDTCLEVVDDFGNYAYFGPDSLLQATLRPVGDAEHPDSWLLRDSFGNEVYMQLGQYGEMLNYANTALIKEVALQRKVGIRGLINQARARLRVIAPA